MDVEGEIREFQRKHGMTDMELIDALATYIGERHLGHELLEFLDENFE